MWSTCALCALVQEMKHLCIKSTIVSRRYPLGIERIVTVHLSTLLVPSTVHFYCTVIVPSILHLAFLKLWSKQLVLQCSQYSLFLESVFGQPTILLACSIHSDQCCIYPVFLTMWRNHLHGNMFFSSMSMRNYTVENLRCVCVAFSFPLIIDPSRSPGIHHWLIYLPEFSTVLVSDDCFSVTEMKPSSKLILLIVFVQLVLLSTTCSSFSIPQMR